MVSAGWYVDPEHAGGLRYWDGASWTEHRAVAQAAPAAPAAPAWSRPPWVKVVIASLIALTSMLGAVGAWRASLAAAEAGDADRKGFTDAVAAQQARNQINSNLDNALSGYLRGKLYRSLADALDSQSGQLPVDDRARVEVTAAGYRELADLVEGVVDRDAVRPDGSLDLDRAFEIGWALSSSEQDLDPSPEFAAADELNQKAERLVGVTALLIAAAVFFTFAQVAASRVFLVYLAGGAIVLVVSVVLLIGLELG